MLTKILTLLATVLLLFEPYFPPMEQPVESAPVLKETVPQENPLRTYDTIHGVEDSVFYIERPSDTLQIVHGSDFGMDAEADDNFPALQAAFAYCRNHPGTCLKLEAGEYYLNNTSTPTLNGARNVLIDGGGATLVFSNVFIGLEFNGSDCVELRNIRFDWDWDKHPLSDIVTVRNASPKTGELDLEFMDREADENTILAAISQCDPDTLTYGALRSNKEVYIYQNPSEILSVKKTSAHTLHITHNGCLKRFKDGETYILRHYVYDTTFAVINGGSKNITFDNVVLYGYPGAGYYAGSMASHFQWKNCYIGVKPGATDRHTSLGADGIHIVNTNGCFNIENCDISGQGDDALNVHDGLGWVKSVNGNSVQILGSAILLRVGDTLRFLNEKYEQTGVTATITALTYHPEQSSYDLTFDRDVSEAVRSDFIVYNTAYDSGNYVVRGNYIHENRARGLLMQSDNGLCEGNLFYKTEMQAIKVVMDISPGLWYEGTGVDRLVIRDNVFDTCDYVNLGEVITIGSNIAGKTATSQPFSNIEITHNTFTEVLGSVLDANNVNGLIFAENTVDAGRAIRKSGFDTRGQFGAYCSNIRYENNSWKNCFLGPVAHCENMFVWARVNG